MFGSGGGIVVLKRLADAIADGDTIHAVIKGSAVNNDGAEKAGYTAPSVNSQADAVVEALANAGVDADSISYVEAHGSGTPVGDPIEITALTKAFRASTQRSGYCAIGSVKTNIGHLDAAAGIAGLIKTVLALKHRQLPPSLHFREANPEIDFPRTPVLRQHAAAGLDQRRSQTSGGHVHRAWAEPTPTSSSRRRPNRRKRPMPGLLTCWFCRPRRRRLSIRPRIVYGSFLNRTTSVNMERCGFHVAGRAQEFSASEIRGL